MMSGATGRRGASVLAPLGGALIALGLTGTAVHFWLDRQDMRGDANALTGAREADATAVWDSPQSAQTGKGANAGRSKPGWVGRWKGTISQPGYSPYPATLQLQTTTSGAPAGSMSYPSLGCTTRLVFLRKDGESFWFTESILQGRGKCQDGGQIAITLATDGTIGWQYFMPGMGGSPMAEAAFTR